MEELDDLQTLRDRYLHLTNQVLPAIAPERSFPVRFNHCFQRIILDNLFKRCWYEVLDRTQGAAYKQLSVAQLKEAIALAEAMVDRPVNYVQELNENSLRWRNKF